MDTLFAELGLSEQEAKLYRYMLAHPPETAAMIAKAIRQTRTNTYMLLAKLEEKGIVVADDSAAVRKFGAANPRALQSRLQAQQQALTRTSKSLELALPDLLATFNLTQQKPGIVHMQGIEGLKASFEDQAKAGTDLLVWGSDIANRDPQVWQIMENGGYKRRAKGIATRALFHPGAKDWPHIREFASKGFDIRLWGEPITGEVLIYDNRVTFTTYEPEIIITVLTNDVMAGTFRSIFETCWAGAEKI